MKIEANIHFLKEEANINCLISFFSFVKKLGPIHTYSYKVNITPCVQKLLTVKVKYKINNAKNQNI